MSMNKWWTPQEHEALDQIYVEKNRRPTRAEENAERSPRLSGVFKLMQRPRVMQKTTAAAELWDWRREEDEEEGHEGKKRNDPSGLFIRQRTCVRRGNQGTADFGSRAVTSVIANLLNKKISWMFSLWQMMSRRFTANREDDVTAVQQLQEDVEDEDFC